MGTALLCFGIGVSGFLCSGWLYFGDLLLVCVWFVILVCCFRVLLAGCLVWFGLVLR